MYDNGKEDGYGIACIKVIPILSRGNSKMYFVFGFSVAFEKILISKLFGSHNYLSNLISATNYSGMERTYCVPQNNIPNTLPSNYYYSCTVDYISRIPFSDRMNIIEKCLYS